MNNASSHTCKVGQIPHENIIHYHDVMLHVQNKDEKMLPKG